MQATEITFVDRNKKKHTVQLYLDSYVIHRLAIDHLRVILQSRYCGDSITIYGKPTDITEVRK